MHEIPSLRVRPVLALRVWSVLILILPHAIFSYVSLHWPERPPLREFVQYIPWFSIFLVVARLIDGAYIKAYPEELRVRGILVDLYIPRLSILSTEGGDGIRIILKDGSEINPVVRDSTIMNTDRYLLSNVQISDELNAWVANDYPVDETSRVVRAKVRGDLLGAIAIALLWSSSYLILLYLIHPIAW